MVHYLRSSFYVLAMLVSLSSCSLFEDALEKDFGLSNTVPIVVTSSSGQQINPTIKEVDFNSGDLAEHKENIKGLSINGITFRVSQFTPTANNTVAPVINGQLEFAQAGSTTFRRIATVSNLDLQAQFSNPPATEQSVPLDASNQQALIDLMKAGSKVQFRLAGTTTSPFASAVIDFKINSTLTASL